MKHSTTISILLVLGIININAQCLFIAPDTVCVGQSVVLTGYSGGPCGSYGIDTHKWNYESAAIQGMPTGNVVAGIHGGVGLASVKENNKYYTFVTNHSSEMTPAFLYRQSYGSSILNAPVEDPILIQVADDSSYMLKGVDLVKDDVWYAFVVGTQVTWFEGSTNPLSSDIIRIRFDNGIEDPAPLISVLDLPDSLLKFPHEIQLVQDAGHWYGIVGNETDTSIVVIDFTAGLNGSPSTILAKRYGYKDPVYTGGAQGISGLSAIKENGIWRVMASTHATPAKLIRFDFEGGLGAKPTYKLLGNPNNSMGHTEDVAFVRDCNHLMAVSVSDFNVYGSDNQPSITLYKFDSTVDGTLTGEKYIDATIFNQARSITDFYNEGGNTYAFVCNSTNVTRLKFSPAAVSHTSPAIPVDTTFAPVAYSYTSAGRYNISVVVDNDVSKTTCRSVWVSDIPAKPIAINQQQVCAGEKLSANADPSVDLAKARFIWIYPDLSLRNEKNPVVDTSGWYAVRNAYGTCAGDTIKRRLSVYPVPAAPLTNAPVFACADSIIPDITATPAVGGTIRFYADSLLKILVTSSGNIFDHAKTGKGTYAWWVTQTVDGCSSVGKKVVLQIDSVIVPDINIPDTTMSACVGIKLKGFTSNPDPANLSIEWWNYNRSSKIDTGLLFKPFFEHLDTSYVFYVMQKIHACPSAFTKVTFDVTGCPDRISTHSVSWEVYPNPASRVIYIEGGDNIVPDLIQILDITGRIVYTVIPTVNISSVDVSDQPAGLYLVRIITQDGVLDNTILKE